MATHKEIIDSLKMNWLPSDFYNCEDLNRVEEAVLVVKEKVIVFRGEIVPIDGTNTTRSESTIEFADSLNRVETNISRLILTFPNTNIFGGTKTNWTHDVPFDFADANRLEKNLYDMYYTIENNITNIPYCGQRITGEEGVF